MKQTLELKLGQQLAMTPQMRQAIRLLQLSTAELRGELRELLDSNYLLEMEEELAQEDWGAGRVRMHDGRGPDSFPEPEKSLRDELFWQLDHARFSDRDHLIATVVIDAIDEHGYLECSTDELRETLEHLGHPAEGEEIESILRRVQRFEPPGVAARSLSECLLRQLEESAADVPHRDLAMRVARNHLAALARHDFAPLVRRLETNRDDLDGALALLRTLNPRPGAGYAGPPTEYVTPDFRVFRAEGGWQVELNAGATPKLRINPVLAELVRRGDRGTGNQSLRQHLTEARWLIKSLASRAETLLRVARAVVRHQAEFLEHGEEERMRPLALREIAAELDVHESTVSRVTSRKYVETPRGVFELRYFFSNQVATADGGGASATAIRARLRKIIEGEEPTRPWSDRHLATNLERAGFPVARRTVAKYRESMGIPPSNERRRARASNLNASA